MGQFELNGTGFALIPNDALGVLSTDNEQPLMNINATRGNLLFEIVERDRHTMVVRQVEESTHASSCYLGAIVSKDRQTVYWVNETKPMP